MLANVKCQDQTQTSHFHELVSDTTDLLWPDAAPLMGLCTITFICAKTHNNMIQAQANQKAGCLSEDRSDIKNKQKKNIKSE